MRERFGLFRAWNFGPDDSDIQPVRWIVEKIAAEWGASSRWEVDDSEQPHEAQMLCLDSSKAKQELGWLPSLHLSDALSMTIEWYQHFLRGESAREKCLEQISAYCARTGPVSDTTIASKL